MQRNKLCAEDISPRFDIAGKPERVGVVVASKNLVAPQASVGVVSFFSDFEKLDGLGWGVW